MLEAVELLQDNYNNNNNNNNNDNDIEFASLDGATQLLPATRQHGIGDATAAPPSTPTLLTSSMSSSFTELQGGELLGERTLRRSESPYLARDDLEVVRGARLTIEPGVTVEFAPTKGLKVRGVLQAVVSVTINFGGIPCSGCCLRWGMCDLVVRGGSKKRFCAWLGMLNYGDTL